MAPHFRYRRQPTAAQRQMVATMTANERVLVERRMPRRLSDLRSRDAVIAGDAITYIASWLENHRRLKAAERRKAGERPMARAVTPPPDENDLDETERDEPEEDQDDTRDDFEESPDTDEEEDEEDETDPADQHQQELEDDENELQNEKDATGDQALIDRIVATYDATQPATRRRPR